MKIRLQFGKTCLGAASMAVAAYALSGCGGSTFNQDSNGVHTGAALPYIYAYQDNVNPTVGSGLGISPTIGNPAGTDVFYFTFASANSAPNNTLTGAGPFATGLGQGAAAGGTFAPGSIIPAAPTSTAVQFRAQGVQGQTTNRTVPDVSTVTLTGPSFTNVNFGFEYDPNAIPIPAGVFVASPYVEPLTTPATSGVYTYSATITDALKETTTTTFEGVVLAPGYGAIASSSSLALTLGHATVAYGPDKSGTTVLIFPAGPAHVSVNGTPTQLINVPNGDVVIE